MVRQMLHEHAASLSAASHANRSRRLNECAKESGHYRDLHLQLRNVGIDTVIITGGETDVCVLSTMLGAIDWGFRVILVTDALCSSADETHDAMMNVYTNRFGEQAETVTTNTLLESWLGQARERR